jgi:hypothetical protein
MPVETELKNPLYDIMNAAQTINLRGFSGA